MFLILALVGYFLLSINFAKSEPHFTSEPEDFTGFQDKFRSLSSEVDGAVNASFQWYHNGIKLNPITSYGATTKKVEFPETALESQGIYQLFVSSKMGRIFGREIKVEFIVLGEFLEYDKKTRNVVIGEKLEIACPKHGVTQHAVYKWGGSGATGTWYFQDKPNALVLGDGRLFFSHVTEDDVKEFAQKGGVRCLLQATDGRTVDFRTSESFMLNATGVSTTSFGPAMVEIPNKEVVNGSTILLRCIAAGYPTPTYEWKYTNQLGETKPVFDKVDGVELLENKKVLKIDQVMKDRHAGTYTCKATINDNGSNKTAEETATVTIREKPTWVEGKNINSATPDIHAQYSWKCLARGDPEPEYKWYANATIMNNVSGRHTIEGGILTFHRLTPEDDGMYQCVAKNKFGFEYQTVSLQVKVQPPTITRLSEEDFVNWNTLLIFCVSDALPAASHHWLFNGTKLEPNKTAKYDLTSKQNLLVHNLRQNDTGIYTCEATNPYGRETKDKFIKVESDPEVAQEPTKITTEDSSLRISSSVTTVSTIPVSTNAGSHEECSDSNACNEVLFIVLFSISLVGNVVLGIILRLQWKKYHKPDNHQSEENLESNGHKHKSKTDDTAMEPLTPTASNEPWKN